MRLSVILCNLGPKKSDFAAWSAKHSIAVHDRGAEYELFMVK